MSSGARDEHELVNVPDRFRALGAQARREALRDLWRARGVLWSLTRRELLSRYRQSLLGVGWAVVTPLATVAVFWFLQRARLLEAPAYDLPYPVFVYAGLLPFQLFQAGVVRGATALSAAPALVSRVRFPRELLVLTALASATFDFVVGCLPLLALAAAAGVAPRWTALLAPLALLPLLLLALGLGLVLSVLNAIVRDLHRVLAPALMLCLFLTPVFYAPAVEGAGRWLALLNPLAPAVDGFRQLVFTGGLADPGLLALSAAAGLGAAIVGWHAFQVTVPRAAELV